MSPAVLLLSLSLLGAAAPADAPLAQAQPAAPVPERFQPKVADPLLAPAPRPPIELKSWDEALTRVRQSSTDERAAAAAVERAEGRARQALGALLPNARLSAGVGTDLLHPDAPAMAPVSGATPTVPTGTANVALTQSVVDLGAWSGVGSARSAERSAQANLEDVRRRLTLGLARSLVSVIASERVAELNRLGLAQALERSALTERTQQLGAATALDVIRIQQDVEVARGILIAGDEQLRRAREALGLAVGIPEQVGVIPGFALQQLVESTRQQCRPVEWEQRPDLVAARENVESARGSTRQAQAGYLPSLGITSNLNAYTADPGVGRFSTWNLAAVLSVPLWEGGSREGLVRERSGAERQAEESGEATRRNVALEVARARRGVEVAEALVKTAASSREKAARLDALTQRSFEVGRSSSVELVQSAAALRQADLALAAREFEWVQARLDAFLTEARCDW